MGEGRLDHGRDEVARGDVRAKAGSFLARLRYSAAHYFLSTMSRYVSLRKIQLVGAAEIGPLMPKTAIW